MDKETMDRLASKAGPSRFNGPQFPSIKLDGSAVGDTAGEFLLFRGKEMTKLGKKISLRILRVRKILAGYAEGSNGGADKSYSSTEYDSSKKDNVALFLREGGEGKMIDEGTPQQLREKYPLKVTSIVYALYDGELVKFRVKGASTAGDTGLYEYLTRLEEAGKHAFQVETKVGVQLIKKNRAVSYHACVFTQGDDLEDGYDVVEKSLDLINDIVESKKQNATPAVAAPVAKHPADDFDTEEEDSEDTF